MATEHRLRTLVHEVLASRISRRRKRSLREATDAYESEEVMNRVDDLVKAVLSVWTDFDDDAMDGDLPDDIVAAEQILRKGIDDAINDAERSLSR